MEAMGRARSYASNSDERSVRRLGRIWGHQTICSKSYAKGYGALWMDYLGAQQ